MAKNNTNKERTYEAIIKLTKQNNMPPTVRELCKEMGLTSTCSVVYYLNKLEEDGKITKNNGISRGITICDENEFQSDNFTKIPLIGTITAGEPILATENYEDVYSMPNNLFSGDELFMLNVKGESMIEAGINDGDLIVVKKQSTANNGEIIAALLDDKATVKRFFKENNRFRLQPENCLLSPIYCDHVDILGKVVGLIRKIF